MKKQFYLLLVIFFAYALNPAKAATILDTTAGADGSFTMANFPPPSQSEPIGQTFTLSSATTNLMAGGLLTDVNDLSAPDFEVTISLYTGSLFTLAPIASQTFILSDGFDGLQLADFSSLGVLSAGSYSLGFSSIGNRGAVKFSGSDNPNTVTLDANGVFTTPSGTDLAVLITGDVSVVPVPAAVWLFGSGLIGLIGIARRKKV